MRARGNTGLDNTSAAFIASCDDDDYWDADKLRLQMTRLLTEPDLMVLGAGIRLLMGEDQVVEWPGDSPIVTREQLLRSRRRNCIPRPCRYGARSSTRSVDMTRRFPSSYAEDYEFCSVPSRPDASEWSTRRSRPSASTTSWFRERAEVVSDALETFLETHPQIAESRAGHARVLGQIAFAKSTMGDRKEAVSIAGQVPVACRTA